MRYWGEGDDTAGDRSAGPVVGPDDAAAGGEQ
jgi:hypothetical protein